MKQPNAEKLFIVLEWIREQTGKNLEKLPEISQLKDGRYKAEIFLPTVETVICCAGSTKLEAMERLSEKAYGEIEKYCKQKFLPIPSTIIKDRMVLVEEDGEVKLNINERYVDKIELKCPICGGTHFIRCEAPLNFVHFGMTYNEEVYGCSNCGYIIMFNKGVPIIYRDTLEKIEKLNEEIKRKTEGFSVKHDDAASMKRHQAILKKLQKQLKVLQELGDDSKQTRALKESIEYEENFIKNGAGPQNENAYKQLVYEIDLLNKERQGLIDSIKPLVV